MPLSGKNVFVGRIRMIYQKNTYNHVDIADNLRNIATNAIQIAEYSILLSFI